MEGSSPAFGVELVEEVPDCVRAEDLVGDVGTEENTRIIVEDGRDETRPQLKSAEKRGESEHKRRLCFMVCVHEISSYYCALTTA